MTTLQFIAISRILSAITGIHLAVREDAMRSVEERTTLSKARYVKACGVALDHCTEAEVVRYIVKCSQAGAGGRVVTVNVDICRQLSRDTRERAGIEGAALVVADGMPLVWASRLMGQALPERIAGSSLIFSLSEAAALAGRSIYLIGGPPGSPEGAANRLSDRYSGLKVLGTDSPPFGFEHNPAEIAGITDRLRVASPDIVYVGLGFPKQERLIASLMPALPSAWFIGCGAAIGFAAGTFNRAPEWMSRSGLEWVHRLAHEPRRLFRRYIVHDLPYATGLLVSAAAFRVTGEVRRHRAGWPRGLER